MLQRLEVATKTRRKYTGGQTKLPLAELIILNIEEST